jgi:hypothetical protein
MKESCVWLNEAALHPYLFEPCYTPSSFTTPSGLQHVDNKRDYIIVHFSYITMDCKWLEEDVFSSSVMLLNIGNYHDGINSLSSREIMSV